MKKIIATGFLLISVFTFSQKYYTKIKSSKVNKERLEISEKFIDKYINKCKRSDYSAFEKFTLSKSFEKQYREKGKDACEKIPQIYGDIKVLNFDSAYLHKYSKDFDPTDLYVFNFTSEKLPQIKYISVWIYHDQNIIGGIWVSEEIPLGRSKHRD